MGNVFCLYFSQSCWLKNDSFLRQSRNWSLNFQEKLCHVFILSYRRLYQVHRIHKNETGLWKKATPNKWGQKSGPGGKMWMVRRQRTEKNLGLSLTKIGPRAWRRRRESYGERQGKRQLPEGGIGWMLNATEDLKKAILFHSLQSLQCLVQCYAYSNLNKGLKNKI